MKPSKWDRRMQRAEELAAIHPFARDVLHFYKRLAGLQKAVYLCVEQARTHNHASNSSSLLGCQLTGRAEIHCTNNADKYLGGGTSLW